MTAVIYARYSSDSQREASIEGQLRDCKDYAEKNGITVVGTYIDRAYSAKTDDRPDFQRMIKDSAKKIFDVVLVWKLDRFARNRFDAVNYKYQMCIRDSHHTVRTRTRFFTRKGSGTFFVYRRFCGKSTQSGKQERIKAGYHRGDGILPLFCGIKFALGAIAAYVRTESLYISGEV